MKTISPQLRDHLAQPVTTLATCWLIVRTDGVQYSFTSFDDDIDVDGVTYSSIAGFARTAIQTNSTGEVDNLELLGFFTDDGITQRDLKNGLFDYASIYVFSVNWADLTQDICRLRRGWLGECTLSPAGIFQAELRGMTQALVQEFGADFMPICRADLGDSKCRVPIQPPKWTPSTTFNQGDYIQAATQTTDALQMAIFQAFTVDTGPGTTGTVEPVWNTTIGTTTPVDGDIYWNSQPYWRAMFTVAGEISQSQFVAALSVPAAPTVSGTTASVSFRANVSAGTTITVSDGLISHGISAAADATAADALSYFLQAMTSYSDWAMTISASGNTVYFSNASGQPGSITKTGDALRGIVISDFQAAPFEGGVLTWIDGDNAGRSMEIKSYDTSTSTVILWLQMYYPIQAGDRFWAYPGCDKRRDTCQTTFNNILNFRGEPDMPMFDKVLSYPQLGMTRAEVQAEARKWVHVRFVKRGRSLDGIDCIGLLIMVGRAFNVPHQDEPDYDMWPRQDRLLLKKIGQYLNPLPPSTARPGTIGVFTERTLPGHVGIFSEKHNAVHLIHARINPGRVLEEPWQHMPREHLRLIALFGFPGLEL